MKKWTIEDSKELYNIGGWGTSYFGINDKGDVYVTPCKDNTQIDLRDIMDDLSEHSPVRKVVFIKSSGVGGTEAMYNWLGYVMHRLAPGVNRRMTQPFSFDLVEKLAGPLLDRVTPAASTNAESMAHI